MARQNEWNMLPMGLAGPLDTRSRPADLGPGVLRWNLNFAINSSGKMSRRAGHAALNFGVRSDSPTAVANWDHHRQGATRAPFTLLQEITSPENVRYLFDGNGQRVSWLDNDTSEWHDIITDGTAGSRWRIASLRDKVVLTNNVDKPRIHTIADTIPATTIADWELLTLTKAKIVISYQNVIVAMNVEVDGERQTNGIYWTDFRDATLIRPGVPDESIAGFKFIDDGEVILNAVELGGVIYIFTDRAIWRMFPQVTDTEIFGFHRWYSEPVSRTACLAYDNAVVSTGKEIFWFGRNTIYRLDQFSSAPMSNDWLLRASGLVFEGDTRLDPEFCQSPVAGFVPDATGSAKEIWWSYPRIGGNGVNDYSLVLSFNIDSTVSPFTTADYVDAGFTAFCNFSRTTDDGVTCNTAAVFIGASGADYSLKSIGGVFHRSVVTLIGNDVTQDIPDVSYVTTQQGYYSQLMFLCPFLLDHREKMLRSLTIGHDTKAQAVENKFRLRIGGSYILADPLSSLPDCGVLWNSDIDDLPAACPDVKTLSELSAEGLKQDDSTTFPLSEQARFLYADLKIVGPNGEPPIGTDSAFSSFSFDYLILN